MSYPKARLTAGLRVSWTPRAGLEPASVTMDSRRMSEVESPGNAVVFASVLSPDASLQLEPLAHLAHDPLRVG